MGPACLGHRHAVMRGAETSSGSATAGSSSRETANRPMNPPSLLEEEDNPPAHWLAELQQSRREVRGFAGVIWEGSPPMLAQGRQHAPCTAHLAPLRCPQQCTGPSLGFPAPCPALPHCLRFPSPTQLPAARKRAVGSSSPWLKFTPPWLHIAYPSEVVLTERRGRGVVSLP